MRKINTSYVVDPSIQQPFTAKSLDFLQDGNKEMIEVLCRNIISNKGLSYNVNTPYYMGNITSPSFPTDGCVFFNNELYIMAENYAGLDYATIDTTPSSTADPLKFTDNVYRNVHNNRYLSYTNVSGDSLFAVANIVNVSTNPVLHYSHNFCNGTNHIGTTSFIANFNNTIVDPAGYYNTTNGKIIPNTSGTYEIIYKAILKENGSFANCWGATQLNKNGSLVGYIQDRKNVTTSTDWETFSGSMIVEANGTTDYFEILVTFTSACNVDLYGGCTVRKLK